MELLDNIKSNFEDLAARTSRATLTVMGILVLFLAAALILLLGQLFQHAPAAKKAPPAAEEPPFHAEDEFLPPQELPLTEDYYFSRITGEVWSREEADRWFTRPDAATVDQLGHANDALIDGILGDAP